MIVDSSAVVAVLLREPERDHLLDRLAASPRRGIGTPTLVETGLVLAARTGERAESLLRGAITELDLTPVVFDDRHRHAALKAFQRYGRGRHPARLNFGDCMSYAVAKVAGAPLLFTGDDFTQTDLTAA